MDSLLKCNIFDYFKRVQSSISSRPGSVKMNQFIEIYSHITSQIYFRTEVSVAIAHCLSSGDSATAMNFKG